ncbi:MAG: oligopeptide ABC transporter permease [Caldicoprobacterales bacterium]|jgi:peptide/nickel transport system permease protein|nr:ABC transporter permease [Clostridiales bacterium]
MPRKSLSRSKDSQAMGPWRVAWERFRKNKVAITGAIIFLTIVLLVIIVPILSPYKISEFELSNKNLPPSSKHWLGTDEQGRDVLLRVFYGGRISILIGLITALITVVIGATVGAISGFYGGRVDNFLMRFTEIIYSLPFMPIMITLSFALMWRVPSEQKLFMVMVILAIISWPGLARLVRGQILSLREQDFIVATTALGLSNRSKIFKHLLPNTLSYIIVTATLEMASAILTEASLSFLGLGVIPPTPTWGNMIERARDIKVFSSLPWLWIPPGILIILTVVSINLLGEGLRDAFDPKEIR